MADNPEYQRGSAESPQLQQPEKGEAQALNEAVAAVPEEVAPVNSSPESQVSGLNIDPSIAALAEAEQSPVPFTPSSEEEKFLFGATARPEEDLETGMLAATGNPRPPENLIHWLPVLGQLAMDPETPESVRGLFNVLAYALQSSE